MPIIPSSLQAPVAPLTLGQQRQQAAYEAYQKLTPEQKAAQQKAAEQSYIEKETAKLYDEAVSSIQSKISTSQQVITNLNKAIVRQNEMLQGEQNRDAIKGIYDAIRQLNDELRQESAKLSSYNQTLSQPKETIINYYQQGYADRLAEQAAREVKTGKIYGVTSTKPVAPIGKVVVSPSVYATLAEAGKIKNVTGIFDPTSGKTFASASAYNAYIQAQQADKLPVTTITRYTMPTTSGEAFQRALLKSAGKDYILKLKEAEEAEVKAAQEAAQRKTEAEIFTPISVFDINAKRQTISYQPRTDKDLSVEARFYKRSMEQELPAIIKAEQLLKSEFDKIQNKINNGTLDFETAKSAWDKRQQEIITKYESESKARQEKLSSELFPKGKTLTFMPDLSKYDVYATAQKFYESKIAQSMPEWLRRVTARTGIGTTSMIIGGYEGLRTEPKKTVGMLAIASGTYLAALGLGAVTGGTAIAPTLRAGGLLMGGLYGGSVVSRIAMTPGYAGKFRTAGEITTTELLPFVLVGGIAKMGEYKPPKIEGLTQKETLRLYELKKMGGYRNPSITSEYASLRAKALSAMGKGAKESEGLTASQKEFNKMFGIKQYSTKVFDESTGLIIQRKVMPQTMRLFQESATISKKYAPYVRTFGEPKEAVFVGFGKTFKGTKEIELYASKLLESGKLAELGIKTKPQAINYVLENIRTKGYIVPVRLQQGGEGFKWTFKGIKGYDIERAIPYQIRTKDIGTEGKFVGFGEIFQKGISGAKIAKRGILEKFSMPQGKGEYLIFKKGKGRFIIESMQKGKITSAEQISNEMGNIIARKYTSKMGAVKEEIGKELTLTKVEEFYQKPFAKETGSLISQQKAIDVTFYGDKIASAKVKGIQTVKGIEEVQLIETKGGIKRPTFRFGFVKVTPTQEPYIIFSELPKPKPSTAMKPYEIAPTPKIPPTESVSSLFGQVTTTKLDLLELSKSLKPSITPVITKPKLTFGMPTKTRLSLGTILSSGLSYKLMSKQLTIPKQELKQELILKQQLLPRQEQLPKQETIPTQIPAQIFRLETTVIPVQEVIPQVIPSLVPSITPSPNPFFFTSKPPIPPEKLGGLWFFPKREKKEELGQAYYPEVRIDATKKVKAHWERISNQPQTKISAISQVARVVDKTISAKGRVVEAPKKAIPIDTGDRYFEINRRKFRGFQQKKGVKYKTPNQIIELQKYRADSPGEIIALKKGKQEARMTRARSFGFS